MRLFKVILISSLLLMSLFIYLLADTTGRLAGVVVDEERKPVADATVMVSGTGLGAFTDVDGSFTIFDVPPGIQSISIRKPGFQAVNVTDIEIVEGQAAFLDTLVLQKGEVSGKVIDVTGSRKRIQRDVTSSRDETYAEKIESMAHVENVADVVATQAGVGKTDALYEPDIDFSYVAPSPKLRKEITRFRYNNESTANIGTEEYTQFTENEFKNVSEHPLSTFSIDVDAASYSNVRRFLYTNNRPPADAVRIEELINYFDYEYPQPEGDDPFAIVTEMSQCPWNEKHQLIHIGLQGKDISRMEMPPGNFVFLLDVSGSMNQNNKLPMVKKAFEMLVENLREEDRVAIVVYAGSAGMVLDSTPGNKKRTIMAAINNLRASGSTAGGQGIQMAYRIALDNYIEGGNNRVILATDGDFNVGVSSREGLEKLIESHRGKGVFLTICGFGIGNYKDSKMETLADKGNGNNYYIDNLLEAKKVFVNELASTMLTIAKDVKLQIEFNPYQVKAYKLIGYENRMLKKEDFNDDTKDAGELGAGHTVTALYEIIPAWSSENYPNVDDLKYQKTEKPKPLPEDEYTDEVLTVKFRYKKPDEDKSNLIVRVLKEGISSISNCSDNFRFSAAVAEFGLLIRGSRFRGEASFKNVIAMAKDAKGSDENGYRAEFIRLAELAEMIY